MMTLLNNETAAAIARYVGTSDWRLPIYERDDDVDYSVLQYYDIPSRYDIPSDNPCFYKGNPDMKLCEKVKKGAGKRRENFIQFCIWLSSCLVWQPVERTIHRLRHPAARQSLLR
ncbi:MAG: hypothetical protein HFH49_14930 [Lachnospiraceae bacterium]|nr:hypothetical protein [Lachnospiraceae bacterium]